MGTRSLSTGRSRCSIPNFDVVQVARGQYVTAAYHNFIGFEVSKPVMERAFKEIYGLELKDVFASLDMSIGTFRWTVSTTIPGMTKVAWQLKEKDIVARTPGATRETFVFAQSRAEYEQQFGTEYKRPGLRHKMLAALLRIVPRFGPFKPLGFEAPTAETEHWFLDSFAKTVEYYRLLVADAARSRLSIADRNFDTGLPTAPGGYSLADETYAELVKRLAKDADRASQVPSGLRSDLRTFYSDITAPIETKKHRKEWKTLLADLDRLHARN
jgi:hypothetical protein